MASRTLGNHNLLILEGFLQVEQNLLLELQRGLGEAIYALEIGVF